MKNSYKSKKRQLCEKNFGIAYRSSTIFYFKKNKDFSTMINFMDYWTKKNL